MSLTIEDPTIKIKNRLVPVSKEEVEVFEGFCQEKRLHHVPRPRIIRTEDRVEGREAVVNSSPLHKGLENLPTPSLVLLIPSYLIEVPEGLHCFRPEEIVSIIGFDEEI